MSAVVLVLALVVGAEGLPAGHELEATGMDCYRVTAVLGEFTPDGGRVDISAGAEDGHVAIAVADTGPGIPAGDLETIFEEFEQSSEGKKVEGTGLGLPLSRKLVELHGGRLWVESEVGRGSTFRFTLPVRPTEPSSESPASDLVPRSVSKL